MPCYVLIEKSLFLDQADGVVRDVSSFTKAAVFFEYDGFIVGFPGGKVLVF